MKAKQFQIYDLPSQSKKVVMKGVSALWALILFVLLSACSSVSERDLAELQSPNAILKKEAIQRISRVPGFPVSLMDGFVNRANEERAVTLMLALLRSGKETKDMKINTLKALGELSKRTNVPLSPLIEKLEDTDRDIRVYAIEALGKARKKEALPALVKLLEEETEQHPVIWALGEIGDKSTIPTLNTLLGSNDEYVRYGAYRALAKIGIGTHQVEGQVTGESKTNSSVDLGKIAFKKYQDMMIIVFQKMAALKKG